MKKALWIALILVLVCMLAFSACDKSETPTSDENNPQTTDKIGENNNDSRENNDDSDNPIVCQHTFGDWSIVKQATCAEEGKRARTCNKCSVTEEASIQKSEMHTPVTDAAVPATCTATGLTEGKHCSVCNAVIVKQNTVAKLPHTIVKDNAVAATCSKTGLTEGSHCSVCKTVITKQTPVEKTAHHYVDGFCTECHARPESTGLEFVKVNGGYAVCGIGTCTDEVINIPTTYNGLSVVEIADHALFFENLLVRALIIPDTVKKVGYNAINANRFITITLGENAVLQEQSICVNGGCEIINHSGKTIASNVVSHSSMSSAVVIHTGSGSILDTTSDGFVFLTSGGTHYLCDYVGEKKDLILPDSYNGEKYIISDRCFFYSDNLEKVTLSAGISEIGEAAFAGSSLADIDFGNCEVKTIPSFCFMECASLQSVVIPNSITTIENQAFYQSGLTSATIGESVEAISVFAFDSCANLIYRAKNCKSISTGALSGVTNLLIGNSVLTIPSNFMKGNEALVSLEFEENSKCTTIGSSAFAKTNISAIVIPETVTTIGSKAFEKCNNLKTVKIESAALQVSTTGVFYSCSVTGGIALTVGKKVTALPKGLFVYTSVTSITFEPDSVCKTIGTSFGGQVKNVVLPASIETINFDSFDLQTLTIDENNQNLGLTDGCIIDLKNAKLLKVFATEYKIPATVKTVVKDAFYKSGVTAIVIPETVEELEQGCLSCSTVVSISLPFIGYSRTEKCSLLVLFGTEQRSGFAVKSYNIGTAHQVDYYYPTTLRELSLASGELTCYLGCFNALQTVRLGKNVTEVGTGILTQCQALTAVYFDGTEAELQDINGNGWVDELPRSVDIVTATE